ncbi:MAG: hypothetical protein SFV51_02560 [Bryobacteraceae bacterium]|nr:hypothetical protein [Bryobacteraceae bacterium]
MRSLTSILFAASAALTAATCDTSEYREQPGLRAAARDGAVTVEWQGERAEQLRAVFAIADGQPLIGELAVKGTGAWKILGRGLKPEFMVTTGKRRISNQQLSPLKALNRLDPAYLEQEKWKVFWDAPLTIPGSSGTNPGLPRTPDEIRRASSSFKTTSCAVRTDGARIEVSFDGLSLGIFSGRLQFTVYKGSNLLRQEAIARTEEPSVAYKYHGGLKGFRLDSAPRVVWRDVARGWQKYEFGGSPNVDPVALRARNRAAFVQTGGGTLAVFPPPHKFFWAREIEMNLGYVYYRKDDESGFSIGVRHGDHEEPFRPYGVSDELWQKRSRQARSFAQGNFALYNAKPGAWQRMALYFYLSAESPANTQPRLMEYTHDDTYKPLPGYQVAISHFHTHFHELLQDEGTLDLQPPWLPTFRAMGINIAMMSDFHGDGHAKDPGPLRFRDQKAYFDGCRRHSDKEFLIMPGEEPDANFGGHYTSIFPRPVYWSHVRRNGQSFEETDATYGRVYHAGSEQEELEMLRKEGGLMWQAHPRTKGSSGYPEAVREKAHFLSDRFLGGSYQSLPADLSEKRLCEERCFSTLDDMNNWAPGPKYMFAEGDTYQKFPEDDTYSHLIVNYVKLDRLPRFDDDWTPVLSALRRGDFFVTSGEILIRSFAIEGGGPKRSVTAELEWTFPLDFVEIVWGDGQQTDRQIIPATALPPFGTHRYRIPFDPAGKKWLRFAAWDSAGNGAFTQPVHLK